MVLHYEKGGSRKKGFKPAGFLPENRPQSEKLT